MIYKLQLGLGVLVKCPIWEWFNVSVLWMCIILGPHHKTKVSLFIKYNGVKLFYISDSFIIQNKKLPAIEFKLICSKSIKYLVLF